MNQVRGFTIGALVFLLMITAGSAAYADGNQTEQLIIINKSTNRLAFFDDHKWISTYIVATGREEDLTPEGEFEIVNKIENRPYYTGGIAGGDPDNPLGDRWLGLDALGTYGTTYAIHGNNNADSIGKYISGGCIRMYNEDIHTLFSKVNVHTKVIIGQFHSLSFHEIAADYSYQVTN